MSRLKSVYHVSRSRLQRTSAPC